MPKHRPAQWLLQPGSNSYAVPLEIRCRLCNKVKNRDAFSDRAQQSIGEWLASPKRRNGNAKTAKVIGCMACSSRERTELHCVMCNEAKGLDSFSKAQRRNPDNARCWPCMQEQLADEPAGDRDDREPDKKYESDHSDASSVSNIYEDEEDGSVSRLTSSMQSTSLRQPGAGGTIYTGRAGSSIPAGTSKSRTGVGSGMKSSLTSENRRAMFVRSQQVANQDTKTETDTDGGVSVGLQGGAYVDPDDPPVEEDSD